MGIFAVRYMKGSEFMRRPVWKYCLTALPFILLLAAWLLREQIAALAGRFPTCPFYSLLGLYCPACGNTRSVLALLQLDIARSLRYNITPLFLLIAGGIWYLEMVLGLWGRRVRLLPRKEWFWFSVLGLFLLYYLVRNFIPYLTP